jgi:N-methylhydantoinase A
VTSGGRRRSVAGIDVGGTFTDLVAWDGESLVVGKVPSTPDDQSRGVIAAVDQLGEAPGAVVHGTTVATNALLERRGASTALVTTEGFEDVLAIGRQDRPSLYDSMADRPEPLAVRRVGVPRHERATSIPDLDAPESIAVSLLYGYRAAAAEQELAATLAATYPNVPISLSSDVVAEFREYERTSTTVLNAYLRPEMSRYLQRLAAELSRVGVGDEVGVMRSSGGLMSLRDAADLPAAALLSGPAGGVVAAARLSVEMGYARAISFDMGGTSTDVSRIEVGEPQLTFERPIAGYPCRMPSVDIHTVGAGGGSIGWRDSGGSLRAGPQSSGAVPGPAAYGRGGAAATVTDANVLLGRIGALGESLVLDRSAAAAAMEALGGQLRLSVEQAAAGMVTVVEETMAGAIRRVSVEEGVDPRGAVLIAFGGAGGLHAAALAKRLNMQAAVVPRFAGVFSALGLLLSPPRIDGAQSVTSSEEVFVVAEQVAAAASSRLQAATGDAGEITRRADVRYLGQSHELAIPFVPGETMDVIARRFHEAHRERNGFARPEDPIEVVTVRAVATGRPVLQWEAVPPPRMSATGDPASRPITCSDGTVRTGTVYHRANLAAGSVVAGPALIVDDSATTYLDPGDSARVAANGALVIEW